jgi:drug/metabolite transporter (DMT)-like permease
MDKKTLIGTLCIIGTTICYGFVPSLSFLAFDQGVQTETLLFNKFFYAAVLMWAYILIKKLPYKMEKKAARMMLVICLSYIGLATTLYFSFNYISGSLATIVSFTFPAMIVAIEMITKMEPVRLGKIVAVALSMIGMAFIVWTPDMGGNLIGIAFAFGTALCYVVYVMGLSSKTMKSQNSLAIAGYVLLSSAVFNFFRCLLSGKPMFAVAPNQLVYVLLLAVVCAFLAIMFYCIGLKYISAGNAAIINTFEPVVACILGYVLIGDILTPPMIFGSVLIVAAVLLTNLPQKSPRLKDKPDAAKA